MLQPGRSNTDHALHQFLQAQTPSQTQKNIVMAEEPGARLAHCIELLKARQKLECLERLTQLQVTEPATNKRPKTVENARNRPPEMLTTL